jgi:hypothetical protein
MTDSFAEFLAEHRAEHRSAFNRWCLAVGDGVVTARHVVDGNLPKSIETTRLHPLWNIRGDIAIARDLLTHRA